MMHSGWMRLLRLLLERPLIRYWCLNYQDLMLDLNLTSQKKVHKINTAMHVINRTIQASQSTVAPKQSNKVVVEDQKSERRPGKTHLTEAMTQLCGEGRRMFKRIGKFNAIYCKRNSWKILYSNGKSKFKCACLKLPLTMQWNNPSLRRSNPAVIQLQWDPWACGWNCTTRSHCERSQSDSTTGLKKLPSW